MNIVDVVIPEETLLPFDDETTAERCAVVVGHWVDDGALLVVTAILEVPNRATDPADDFVIMRADAKAVLAKHRLSEDDMLGPFHTHPKGSPADPSYSDIAGCPEGALGLVYHVPTGTLTFYDHTGYLGRVQ